MGGEGAWPELPTPEWLVKTRRTRREVKAAVAEKRRQQREAPPSEPLRKVEMHAGASKESSESGDESDTELIKDRYSRVPREDLIEGKTFWCWDMDEQKPPYTTYSVSFPIVILEEPEKGVHKVRCMCLTDGDRDGVYVPDDRKAGKHSYLDTEAVIAMIHYDSECPAPLKVEGQERQIRDQEARVGQCGRGAAEATGVIELWGCSQCGGDCAWAAVLTAV